MNDLNLMTIKIDFDLDGKLEITTEMNPVCPEIIGELDLRSMIVNGIATAYLDSFNDGIKNPERQEMLKRLAQMIKATHFVYDPRNPKSTENDHEII